MKLQTLALSMVSLACLAACKSTPEPTDPKPPQGAVDRRAQLESIQSDLAKASSSGYGSYLVALRGQSAKLQELATPPDNAAATKDLAIRQLVTAISAGSLLADLPAADDATRSAVRATAINASALDEACKTAAAAQADCALGQVYKETVDSRSAAADVLQLAGQDGSVEADKVTLAYQTFAASLPKSSGGAETDATKTKTALLRSEACTVSWGHSLLLSKVPSDSVMALNGALADVLADILPMTGIDLCADGGNQCEAQTDCDADANSPICKGMKSAAVMSDCGPVTPDLAAALR